jgi:hypothetical protein
MVKIDGLNNRKSTITMAVNNKKDKSPVMSVATAPNMPGISKQPERMSTAVCYVISFSRKESSGLMVCIHCLKIKYPAPRPIGKSPKRTYRKINVNDGSAATLPNVVK